MHLAGEIYMFLLRKPYLRVNAVLRKARLKATGYAEQQPLQNAALSRFSKGDVCLLQNSPWRQR
jgi:hypothetical protein